jgi:hypothetical protein
MKHLKMSLSTQKVQLLTLVIGQVLTTVNIIVVFWDLMPCSLMQWRGTSVSEEPAICILNFSLRSLTWRKQVYPIRLYVSTTLRRLIPEDYEDGIKKLKHV